VEAATRGSGARASGGRIAPGGRADLIVLDDTHVDLTGRSDDTILDALVFSGGRGLVRDVMVGGHWAVREGHHPAEDAIAARYRATLARLLA
jgi:formimidoylglutamate deiminase